MVLAYPYPLKEHSPLWLSWVHEDGFLTPTFICEMFLCRYNLYGVANHSGTLYSGHYTAYCKHPYSAEWHEYNDSR